MDKRSPSNPLSITSSLDPSYPHPHLALHRKLSHSYELEETYIHLLCTAVPQLSRPTYLIMTEITLATIDCVLAVQGTNCFPYVISLNFHKLDKVGTTVIYRRGNRGSERLSVLIQVTQLVSAKARIRNQVLVRLQSLWA